MLIEVAVILVSYAGIKLHEKYKKAQQQQCKPQQPESEPPKTEYASESDAEQPAGMEDTGGALRSVSPPPQEPGNTRDTSIARYQHYREMSLFTMGLVALRTLFPFLSPISLASYIYTAFPVMEDVEKALVKDHKVNVDVLFFIGNLLAISIDQFFPVSFGLWVRYTGRMGAEKTKNRSHTILTSVFEQLPHTVWVLIDQVEVEVPLQDVRANDIVIAKAGEVIPVDGLIMEGMASIDQHVLTGEAQPAEKEAGDQVYANTLILAGRIHIRVEQSGEETRAAHIKRILLQSTDFKSQIQLKGEAWANKAVVPMLVASGVVLPTFGVQSTVVFIKSHIGNRIRFLAPLGTLRHIAMAAQQGILIKDGRALEGLGDVDTVLFDKTGTLTTGEPEIVRILPCRPYREQDILGFAASAEQKLTHPLARAILKKADAEGIMIEDIQDSTYQMGYGMTISQDDTLIRVGSRRFITAAGITIPDQIRDMLDDPHTNGNTLIFVTVDQHVGGAIELQPQIRPEMKQIIQRIRQQGITHCAIISGDHRQPTQTLAEELGMDEYFYEVLPEEKARLVEQLQQQNRSVCFVGDGINDALAMQQAQVSISLAGATTMATDVADIIFMDGTLQHLDDLFEIAHKLDAYLKKCLKFVAAPGIINLAGAFVLQYNIMTAALVSTAFGGIAMADVMKPLDPSQEKFQNPLKTLATGDFFEHPEKKE